MLIITIAFLYTYKKKAIYAEIALYDSKRSKFENVASMSLRKAEPFLEFLSHKGWLHKNEVLVKRCLVSN